MIANNNTEQILRYETAIERSIYRALHELQRLQASRLGEKPPAPISVDVDISKASGALVNVIGGNDMTLDEYKQVMEILGKKIPQGAKIISGAQISPDMDKTMKVLLIVTGVTSPQITGASTLDLNNENEGLGLGEELGIDFVKE